MKRRKRSHAGQALLLSVVLVGGLIAPAAAAEGDGIELIEVDRPIGEGDDEVEEELEEVDPAAGCDFTAEVTGEKLSKYKYEKQVETVATQVQYKKQVWDWKWSTPWNKRTEANVGRDKYGSFSWVRVGGQWQYSPLLDEGVTSWGDYTADEPFRIGHTWYRYTFYDSQEVPGEPVTETRWSFNSSLGGDWGEWVDSKVVNHRPNAVWVYVDGEVVDRAWFGESWTKDYTLEHEQSFKVKVKALGERKWEVVDEGTAHCPPQPEDLVTESEFEDGEWACDDTHVTQFRTVTTTPYIWDADELEWVEDTENAEVAEEAKLRELTEEEFYACPDEPEVLVTSTEWEDGTWECDDTEVTQTRTVTTTPWLFDEESETWVEDEENAVTEEETQTRELTEDEAFPCTEVADSSDEREEEPEVLEVSVQSDETEVLADSAALPSTGASVLALLMTGLLALFAGTTALRRRQRS